MPANQLSCVRPRVCASLSRGCGDRAMHEAEAPQNIVGHSSRRCVFLPTTCCCFALFGDLREEELLKKIEENTYIYTSRWREEPQHRAYVHSAAAADLLRQYLQMKQKTKCAPGVTSIVHIKYAVWVNKIGPYPQPPQYHILSNTPSISNAFCAAPVFRSRRTRQRKRPCPTHTQRGELPQKVFIRPIPSSRCDLARRGRGKGGELSAFGATRPKSLTCRA